MASRLHKDLKLILHPYCFVLKEGKTIGTDYLDYALMMLHVNCTEVLKSPKQPPVGISLPGKKKQHPASAFASDPQFAPTTVNVPSPVSES